MDEESKIGSLATAWLQASQDLKIEVVAPYELDGLAYAALVRDFGTSNGMLILDSWDQQRATAAEQSGFGYSCMDSPFYQSYDRNSFIEALTDWRWSGDPSVTPEWYVESNQDEEAI